MRGWGYAILVILYLLQANSWVVNQLLFFLMIIMMIGVGYG